MSFSTLSCRQIPTYSPAQDSKTAQQPPESTRVTKPTVQTADQNTAMSQDQQQQPANQPNQYTNSLSSDAKSANQAVVIKVQVSNAASNPNPFHVSLNGSVGQAAARVVPGASVSVQTELSGATGAYPVVLTLSRNGSVVGVLTATLKTTSASVMITETAPNQFSAQWK